MSNTTFVCALLACICLIIQSALRHLRIWFSTAQVKLISLIYSQMWRDACQDLAHTNLFASFSSSPQMTHIYWLAWTLKRFTQRRTVSSHTKARWLSLRASRRPHGSWWTSPCIWLACRWASLSSRQTKRNMTHWAQGDCLSQQCDYCPVTTHSSGRLLLHNFSCYFPFNLKGKKMIPAKMLWFKFQWRHVFRLRWMRVWVAVRCDVVVAA